LTPDDLSHDSKSPKGNLSLRTIAMPADTNPSGQIFGGWLMSQMDLAAGTHATYRADGPCATIAVDGMVFHAPVFVGDEVSCFTEITKIGRTSMTLLVEAWVRRRRRARELVKVTSGLFHFVALGEDLRPRALPTEPPEFAPLAQPQ
jgi:acyl-CoA thioesterase YciA